LKGLLPESALTNHDLDVSGQSSINPDLPASFTAGRNILFLTIAGSYAVSIGAKVIITGVCQTDYSGYPDCRQTFIDSMEETLNRGLIGNEDVFAENRIGIFTPLMNLTKAETWKLAKSFGAVDGWDPIEIIRELTMTDYNGDMTWNDWGRGKLDNPASILRAKGYRDAVEKGWI
jgi:7-cyano-7-deazaguanine synthase